jgi:hypothetical protein
MTVTCKYNIARLVEESFNDEDTASLPQVLQQALADLHLRPTPSTMIR